MELFVEHLEFVVDPTDTTEVSLGEIVTKNPGLELSVVDTGDGTFYLAKRGAECIDGAYPVLLAHAFKHLPGFLPLHNTLVPVGKKAKGAEVGDDDEAKIEPVCRIRCAFESDVPYFRLAQQFNKHVATGCLKPGAAGHGEYIAIVDLDCEANAETPANIEALLRRAFEADTQQSAINFRDPNTKVIEKSPAESTEGQ